MGFQSLSQFFCSLSKSSSKSIESRVDEIIFKCAVLSHALLTNNYKVEEKTAMQVSGNKQLKCVEVFYIM